jgi:hypothetical protein
VTWTRNSPEWMFDEATLHRATVALDNPDCVDVELHFCRYRLGFAPDHRSTRRLSSNQYSRLIQGDLRDVSGR